MLWQYIRKKVKKSLYPDLIYWSDNLPRGIRLSIYKKYKTLNIRFEYIPEAWGPMLYYFYFNQKKHYHYPTDDDIKFFYFTLFKKNGFIFMLLSGIIFKDCFLEFISLLFKSAITFYLILCVIYTFFYVRKHLRISLKFLFKTPRKLYPTLFIVILNSILNLLLNNRKKKKQKWYF